MKGLKMVKSSYKYSEEYIEKEIVKLREKRFTEDEAIALIKSGLSADDLHSDISYEDEKIRQHIQKQNVEENESIVPQKESGTKNTIQNSYFAINSKVYCNYDKKIESLYILEKSVLINGDLNETIYFDPSNAEFNIDNVDTIFSVYSDEVKVEGDLKELDVIFARYEIVTQYAETVNGNNSCIVCDNVLGDAKSQNGNIICYGTISQNAKTSNGNINADRILGKKTTTIGTIS